MNHSHINDIRTQKEFTGMSFSEYKKTEVKKELIKSISESHIEQSLYWSAELICAGHFVDLWEIIFSTMANNIHSANPKLPIYINQSFESFKKMIHYGFSELELRNKDDIRHLFVDLMYILCTSHKKHSFQSIKINTQSFDLSNIHNKLKADKPNYVSNIFIHGDPPEMLIFFNELKYQITKKNLLYACYWINLCIEFDLHCRKKKTPVECVTRTFAPVDYKFQKDSIWIVWEILFDVNANNKFNQEILNSLLSLFSVRYKFGTKRRRRQMLYFAVELTTENINPKISLMSDPKTDKEKMTILKQNIDKIYTKIKKEETAPNTDYLFQNMSKKEKILEKLDMFNKVDPLLKSQANAPDEDLNFDDLDFDN